MKKVQKCGGKLSLAAIFFARSAADGFSRSARQAKSARQ
jgi:hypothetical protein